MIFFDSHCHLYDKSFGKDFSQVLDRAKNDNILKMVVVGTSEKTSKSAVNLACKFDNIYASVGIHPHYANQFNNKILNSLIKLSKKNKVVAWGEIGLDFNRMYSDRKDQEFCFIKQIEAADNQKMPVILHERDTKGELLKIINAHHDYFSTAVIHCFSGNEYELERYLEIGFYIGITGIISILKRGKNLRNLVRNIPTDKIMVETDAPYLVPVPQNNKTRRNEPAFVKSVLVKLAEVLQEDVEVLSEQVWKNTCSFFKLSSYK